MDKIQKRDIQFKRELLSSILFVLDILQNGVCMEVKEVQCITYLMLILLGLNE